MEKPKKEPILVNQDQDYKLCLNCGFPNRNSDKSCIYCSSSLIEDEGLFAWFRQTYYVLRWRWQLKQKRTNLNKESQSPLFKTLGYFLIGVGLSGVSLYIFTLAVNERSFSNGLIAALFFLYGFFTLKSLFFRK